MKTKNTINISVGVSSILMIFVVLCLTTFGVLSYLTVNSDIKLTQRSVENTKDYYKAYSESERTLAGINYALSQAFTITDVYSSSKPSEISSYPNVSNSHKQKIEEVYKDSSLDIDQKLQKVYLTFVESNLSKCEGITTLTNEKGETTIFYITEMNDTYQLQTKLLVNNYSHAAIKKYSVTRRNLVNIKQWKTENLEVWGG